MTAILSVFRSPPDGGRGFHRDMRVRWALGEAGQPYQLRHVAFSEMRRPDYLEKHPFGQMPVYEEGELVLFESGAIVLHIAQSSRALLPYEHMARSRAMMWMFAALNTIEPCIFSGSVGYLEQRLHQLANALGDRTWLEGDDFSAGDLLMISVLRSLHASDILLENRSLHRYIERGEQRPAFHRALGQLQERNKAG